mmetsp:Transcript_26991/g.41403  ORF Transcript_26991/g.41403 Transcript_26991/m.41403 type:complete len:219 (+) Transcript_26991:87-743(+)
MVQRFTEELRDAVSDQWERVVNHKFTKELAAGTIDRNVLKKYLIQDHRFLDAFLVLLASMVANARSLSDRIPGCQFIGVIAGKENTYFERCFEKLGCSNEEERAKIADADCTAGFINLMRDAAANGSLGEKLAVLVVCEWSYLSWGQAVQNSTNRDAFETYEWVDLHSGEYFESVVSYLRGLLDKEGELIDAAGKEACLQRFSKAIQLEEDFFEHAYS